MIRNITVSDTEEKPTGHDLYADRLCHPEKYATTPDAPPVEPPSTIGDGSDLRGYDKFCFNLTHPKKPAAKHITGNTSGGR
jgi:hypothetical protein